MLRRLLLKPSFLSHARTACSSSGTRPSLGAGAAEREEEEEEKEEEALERDDDAAVEAMACVGVELDYVLMKDFEIRLKIPHRNRRPDAVSVFF